LLDLRKEPSHACLFDVGNGQTIRPGAASILAYVFPGPPQNIGPEDAVIERMEPAIPAAFGRLRLACAGVVVFCLRVELTQSGYAPTRTSSLSMVEAAALPYIEFCCLDGRWYYDRLRLLTRRPRAFRWSSL
jgi:hypothetical protein